jgi:hypothetical protein
MLRLGPLFSAISLLVSCGARSDIDRISSDAGPTTCEDMERELAKKLAVAQACDPSLDEPSCNHVVEGECCLEVVSPENPKAITDYEAALARGRANGCFSQFCKNVKCALPITGDCVALPASSMGRCEPVF